MKFALFSFALCCASTVGMAQSFEASVSGGISKLTNNAIGDDVYSSGAAAGAKVRLTDGFRLAFRMGFNLREHAGAELGYAYSRSKLHFDGPPVTEQGFGIHQGFVDGLLYATREKARVRPFAAAGIHFSNFVPPGSSAQYGQGENKFGVNYGGGVKVRLTEKYQIRFDVRQYEMGKPFHLTNASGRLFMNEISAGFGVVI